MGPAMATFSVVCLATTCLLVVLYSRAAFVEGSEFDTATWSVRSFHYWLEPLSQRQLSGIVRSPATPLFASNGMLVGKSTPAKYWTRKNSVPARWDLVYIRSGLQFSEGPARIIITYLSSNLEFWLDWSSKHPLRAAAFWPAIKDLVDLGCYSALPDIMDLVNSECSDDQFVRSLQQLMTHILTNDATRIRADDQRQALAVHLQTIYASPEAGRIE